MSDELCRNWMKVKDRRGDKKLSILAKLQYSREFKQDLRQVQTLL